MRQDSTKRQIDKVAPLRIDSADVLPDHLLMTEFGNLPRCLPAHRWPQYAAGLVLLGLAMVLIAGHLARGNAQMVRVRTHVLLDGASPQPLHPLDQFHGYGIELNHGPFYLLLAPLGAALAMMFVDRAGDALKSLHRQGLFRPRGQSVHALRRVATTNRWLFRCLIPLLVVAAMCNNFGQELLSWHGANAGRTSLVGYAQADLLTPWLERLEGEPSDQQWQVIRARFPELGANLERSVAEAVYDMRGDAATLRRWSPYIRLKVMDQAADRGVPITVMPTLEKDAFGVDIEAALRDGANRVAQGGGSPLIILEPAVAGGPVTAKQQAWFNIFWVLAIGYEALYHALAVWTLAKILFWLWVIYVHLPASQAGVWRRLWRAWRRYRRIFRSMTRLSFVRRSTMIAGRLCRCTGRRVTLDRRRMLMDVRGRFGLDAFTVPYNAIVGMILMAGLVLCFMYISQSSKATFLSGFDNAESSGQVKTGGLAFMTALIFTGTVLAFDLKLGRVRRRWVQRLECRMAQASSSAARETIEQQMQTVQSQTCWPTADPTFRRLALLAVILLLVPVFARTGLLPASWSEHLDLFRAMEDMATDLMKLIYELDPR